LRFLLLPHYPHIGPQAGLRSCGLYYIDMLAVGNGLCQPGGGRWALGFGDRKHRRTAVETRSAAALGQQVLCCRWSARGSIKRAPANSQRPPACITTNQQPLGRAKSADGPASAASHRSNMAFLSTRTPTPPGRGPVNTAALLPEELCCPMRPPSAAILGVPRRLAFPEGLNLHAPRRAPLDRLFRALSPLALCPVSL